MKGRIFVLLIGIVLGVLVAVPLTALASSGSLPFVVSLNGKAQETQPGQGHAQVPSETHQRMHDMMDAMHGEGFSERMHQAMPESEEMMEECASMMDMMGNMEGMMNGMKGSSGTMDGMGPMMESGGMMGPSGANP